MIRLQFVLGAGLSSRLIAWYGNGYRGYSHVDAILRTGELLGARADAIKPRMGGKVIPPGVQIRPPFYEKWVRRCVVEIDSTREEALRWETYLRRQEKRPYDTGSILGFILGEELHQAGHWICSAVQREGLEHSGKLPHIVTPPAQTTPNTLFFGVCAIGGRAREAV